MGLIGGGGDGEGGKGEKGKEAAPKTSGSGALTQAGAITPVKPIDGFSARWDHIRNRVLDAPAGTTTTVAVVRCAFSDRNLHSRMPFVPTPARLKLLHARD
jgi:hypothetical protein